jgi:hypothetical protein
MRSKGTVIETKQSDVAVGSPDAAEGTRKERQCCKRKSDFHKEINFLFPFLETETRQEISSRFAQKVYGDLGDGLGLRGVAQG